MNKILSKHMFFVQKKYGRGVFYTRDDWAINDVKNYIFEHEPSIGKRQAFGEARVAMEEATNAKLDAFDYLQLAIELGLLK